jgi:hypothetical protein
VICAALTARNDVMRGEKVRRAAFAAGSVPRDDEVGELPPCRLLIPINLTVGTSTYTSEVYTGQWNQLLVGIRTGFTLKFLGERFIDNGQYAFLAYLRGDIQLAQPAAFAVDLGVRS